jgi:hypothetical protein
MVQRVWLLAAGFSIPWGGPGIRELFTERSLRSLQKHFPNEDERCEKLWEPAAGAARSMYTISKSSDETEVPQK